MRTNRMVAWAAMLAIGAAAMPASGQANETWDAGGATDDWSEGNNWLDNTAPVIPNNNQFHLFGAAGIAKLATDMNADYVFGQLQFAANGYSVNSSTGSTMSLSGFNDGRFITSTAGVTGSTVNVPITLNNANTTNTAGNANLRTIDTNTGAVTLNGTLIANADPARNFAVRKIGAGALTLGAANVITSTFEATNGNVFLGNDLSLGTAGVLVANGAANTVRYASSGAAARTLANNFTVSGLGVLAFGDATNTGPITLNGTVTLGDAVNAKPIAVIAGNTVTAAGGWTGAGGWVKNNPGTLVLNGANNYAGLTTVGAGTLRLNGTITGAAGVGGGVLEGTGTVGGGLGVFDVDLADANLGGRLAPGTAGTVGTLKGSTASFGTGGGYLFDVIGATGDLLQLTGALTASATAANPFAIVVSGTGFANGTSATYTLVDGGAAVVGFDPAKFTLDTSAFAPGATGTFALALADANTNLVLTYTAVPEPAALGALALAGVAMMRRRR